MRSSMSENQKPDNKKNYFKNCFDQKFDEDLNKIDINMHDNQNQDNNTELLCINSVMTDIKKIIKPDEIILFHKKVDNAGKVISFKICLVVETNGDFDEKLEIEKNIYKNIDSDVPFDVIIYTCDEWDRLKFEKHSFANNILKRGDFFSEQK